MKFININWNWKLKMNKLKFIKNKPNYYKMREEI